MQTENPAPVIESKCIRALIYMFITITMVPIIIITSPITVPLFVYREIKHVNEHSFEHTDHPIHVFFGFGPKKGKNACK